LPNPYVVEGLIVLATASLDQKGREYRQAVLPAEAQGNANFGLSRQCADFPIHGCPLTIAARIRSAGQRAMDGHRAGQNHQACGNTIDTAAPMMTDQGTPASDKRHRGHSAEAKDGHE